LIVPGPQSFRAKIGDIAGMDSGFIRLARKCTNRFRVRNRIRKVPGKYIRGNLAHIHELAPPANSWRDQSAGDNEHSRQHDDQ
jgi:hypothetical protein